MDSVITADQIFAGIKFQYNTIQYKNDFYSAVIELDQRIIDKAVGEWRKKRRACVTAGVGQFEHKM